MWFLLKNICLSSACLFNSLHPVFSSFCLLPIQFLKSTL
uniref:Uncharacterized protein n=1 Tax=Rhizophora mucronata TaxID=61149 RepID=A0A2P2Q2Z7_RHIMU